MFDMNKYFLAIIALIIFSIIFILYIRISARISQNSDSEENPQNQSPKVGDDDSTNYDNVSDPLSHLKSLKSSDFTLLE
jgi:hypothetical protein